jgi:hypothetical protein
MKLRTSLLATAASLAATGAIAETNYLYGELSYGQIDFVYGGPALNELDGSGAYEGSTGAFTYGADISYKKLSSDFYEYELKSYNVELGYAFTPSLSVVGGGGTFNIYDQNLSTYYGGLEYAYNDFTFGLGGVQRENGTDTDETGYAFVEYDNGTYSANIGYTKLEDSEVDVWVIGAEYESDRFELEMDSSTISFDGFTQGLITLDGKYNIRENVRLVAEVNHFHFDSFDTGITSYQIGAGYQIRDDLWLDATFGSQSFDGEKIFDTLNIGITIDTGKRKLRTRENLFNLGDYYTDFFLGAA